MVWFTDDWVFKDGDRIERGIETLCFCRGFIYFCIYFAFAKDRNTHTRTALCSKYTRLLIAAVGLLCCYILHLSLLCCHPPWQWQLSEKALAVTPIVQNYSSNFGQFAFTSNKTLILKRNNNKNKVCLCWWTFETTWETFHNHFWWYRWAELTSTKGWLFLITVIL